MIYKTQKRISKGHQVKPRIIKHINIHPLGPLIYI